jgi:hypothetical protein
MEEYLPLVTIFVSGLFGLVVAAVTSVLSNRREASGYLRTRRRERYERTLALYVDIIANLERCIRVTERIREYSVIVEELPKLNAQLRLLSTEAINQQSDKVGDLMYQWSSEYRKGMPKPISDTGMAMMSSHDGPHLEKAKELFPGLSDEIQKLISLMRSHIESIEV